MHKRGRALLLQAYAKPTPTKGAIRAFLARIFHTKDDEFIETCRKACRGSSFRLLGYVGDKRMPELRKGNHELCTRRNPQREWTSEQKPRPRNNSASSALFSKSYEIKNHNTAWIIDKHWSMEGKVKFKRPKRFKVGQEDQKTTLHDTSMQNNYHCIRAIQRTTRNLY